MSEQLRESVSALMDGEIEELELRRLLQQADSDAVRDTWADFNRQQQALHGDVGHSILQLDISAQVRDAIAAEQEPVAAKNWWKSLGSVAVAASVAAVVVMSSGQLGQESGVTTPAAEVAGRVYPATVSAATGNVAVSAQYSGDLPGAYLREEANAEAQKRLERHLLEHTGQVSQGVGQGMMAFARVAAFEDQ